jgi:hypothetical protein
VDHFLYSPCFAEAGKKTYKLGDEMKKIVALVVFMGLVSGLALAESGSWTGWINDAKCGAKVNADCAKKCAAAGEKMVFVTADKNVIAIANQDAVKGHEGHHVTLKGNLDKGTLTVTSVEMVKEPAAK